MNYQNANNLKNMQDTPDLLIAYCKEEKRVCPQPTYWNAMYKLLPARAGSNEIEKCSPPLILTAWHEASPLLKMIRLEEQIKWASEYGHLAKVSVYLRGLREEQWFHIGE
jgi:hypothetical protein